MKNDPGSELNRALLHRITRTRNKMKQLQTSPHCRRATLEIHVCLIIIMLCFKQSETTLDLHLVKVDLNYTYDFAR